MEFILSAICQQPKILTELGSVWVELSTDPDPTKTQPEEAQLGQPNILTYLLTYKIFLPL